MSHELKTVTVYVNAYREYAAGGIKFTRGYETIEQAAAMRVKGRGKSVRYINRRPIPVVIVVD